ncbi:type I restriction enzyme HsdR N-terminal domain-containing protein [Aeoliella sp. SH292]|uniref:type I restriction enzyme HsdR N-terminal domain-containing protein n=1 Tax=Aeoliella sp. SH292 TaxID=3454464 RepID=UPI003F954DBF
MNKLLGIAVCDECNSRIQVLEKHASLIGKAVRCPKCHTRFVLQLEPASTSDEVAVQAQAEESEKPRKRRSKDQIRQEHIAAALDGFRTLHSRLAAISEDPKSSEEQIRVWCMDVLRTALGYADEQLNTELRVMGGRIDIAVMDGNEVLMVIECKNIRSRLNHHVRDQGGMYAATLTAPWALITNGDLWKLYRVTPQKGQSPRLDLVFDVSLLDEDGVSEADAENLYLLTSRALTSGDTENEYHQVRCTSAARTYDALFSDRVVSALRLELAHSYKGEHEQNVRLLDDDAVAALHELLTPLEFGK